MVLLGIMLLGVMLATGCSSVVKAKSGDTVKIHYTGTLEDGTVFDTSVEHEPLEFTLGQGQLIPSFEQAVIGMKVGDLKTINIPADQAYGPYRDDLILVIERSQLPEDLDPKVGQQLQMIQADGSSITVIIIEISETTATIDVNHPLAGKNLTFEIELVEIE
jgi:peptidylprolyl isomerase